MGLVMPYYEFTVQIYENEEIAKEVYRHTKHMKIDTNIEVSVLWKIEREVID